MKRRRNSPIVWWAPLLIIVVAGVTFAVLRLMRPLPPPSLHASASLSVAAKPIAVPMPATSELAEADANMLAAGNNSTAAVPIASIAKIITILTVLQKYPLSAGQQGPVLTMTTNDSALYSMYNSEDGSTVPVAAGEQISEYQVIEAMMLPSANNMADTLAHWAYGSQSAYKTAAQNYLKDLGATHTVVGSDASGFLPDTTSTPSDLLLLAETALKQPVIREIAALKTANIPVAGAIYTTNLDLGVSGIDGLKTGTSDQAGNCFLFSSTHDFGNGTTKQFVGVVLNTPGSQDRYTDAANMLNAAYGDYQTITIAHKDQQIGTITTDWGTSEPIIAGGDVSTFDWIGTTHTAKVSLNSATSSIKAGQTVGSIQLGSSSVPLLAKAAVSGPSFWWRLFHS